MRAAAPMLFRMAAVDMEAGYPAVAMDRWGAGTGLTSAASAVCFIIHYLCSNGGFV